MIAAEESALVADGLTKRFGAFTAVDRLDLAIRPGEVFGLLGSNGAGKSTAIRMFCGLLRPTGGRAFVLGVDVAAEPERVKRGLGYMTQRFSLYQDLTVRQNLRFYGGVYGLDGARLREAEGRVAHAAGLSGMHDVPAGHLAGGFRQRLALACAVLHRPRILFLDEPTGGVDPLSRRMFWSLIDDLASEGVTVIVTTHNLDEAEHCGRTALMHGGRLVAVGTLEELRRVFAGRSVLEVACPRYLDALRSLEAQPFVLECALFGTRLHLVVGEAAAGERAVLEILEREGNVPCQVQHVLPSLEDVFIHSITAVEAAPGGGGASVRMIGAVAVKELRQISRDPFSLLMLLGIPTFMLLLYGYALSFDVKHVALAVQDRSRSPAARELVATFVHSTYFDQVADLPARADLAGFLERGSAKAVLVIPEGFATDLAEGRKAEVQILVDGTDATTGSTVLAYSAAAVADANTRLRTGRAGEGAAVTPISFSPRVWYNPELRSTQFIVPGLIGFILMLTAVLSTALSLVREKERGTMERLRVSALRPSHLVIGKTLPYLAISLLATTMILVVARALFDVRVSGSYRDLFVAVIVYLLGALGLGLLVSSVSHSQAMAFQVGSLVSILPAIFLSGFIFPIDAMPRALQVVTYAFPARYFLVILRGIVLKGAGLSAYPADVFFLVLYAVVVLGLAWARLVRREA